MLPGVEVKGEPHPKMFGDLQKGDLCLIRLKGNRYGTATLTAANQGWIYKQGNKLAPERHHANTATKIWITLTQHVSTRYISSIKSTSFMAHYQSFCHDKYVFVATTKIFFATNIILLWQIFCHGKHTFVATKDAVMTMILVPAPAGDSFQGSCSGVCWGVVEEREAVLSREGLQCHCCILFPGLPCRWGRLCCQEKTCTCRPWKAKASTLFTSWGTTFGENICHGFQTTRQYFSPQIWPLRLIAGCALSAHMLFQRMIMIILNLNQSPITQKQEL